ncbi:3'5'-cyclic nucleotide phosphodiesterase [Kipferlia bialata]|uniref:3'5'-cyclic nucleotide phosphodiesterase n=1 Tax=Kipferlia bialata TaxID=797122 RepID=A0A9K3D016_9EUKA|nr:3'5'-cyclic nucleotide phosphodiesterase [Kipferlia bialata]|eukprot:g8486.t1
MDVLQMLGLMVHSLRQTESGRTVLPLASVYILLLAAAGHDLEHTGKGTDLVTNTRYSLSTFYKAFGEDSPVEVSHAHLGVHVLRKYSVPADGSVEVEHFFKQAILSTDPKSQHPARLVRELPDTPSSWDTRDRHTFLSGLIRLADISNPTRVFSVSREHTNDVTNEFWATGDIMRGMDMKVPPQLDRRLGLLSKYKGQVFFIGQIVRPEVESLRDVASVLDGTTGADTTLEGLAALLDGFVSKLETNTAEWRHVAERHMAERHVAERHMAERQEEKEGRG